MSEPANKIICNICSKEFKFPYLLENHKNSKRKCKPIYEKIQCQDCNILYFNS
jgi:ribosomal protein S27E